MKIRVGILTAPKIEYERREDTFVLKNVRIGIGFHWDRFEDQEFAGELTIRNNPDGTQTAINTIDLEDYLCSVISSEMNANSPMELLKAHAVISRSWAIRAISRQHSAFRPHEGYDVCADDHCQRYEGLRRMNERAVEAVRETQGQVLISDKVTKDQVRSGEWEICDCRYHKCCGGRTEVWRTCWEDKDVPYIQSVQCDWCDPQRKSLVHRTSVLRTSLNDYDQETRDFHDWQVSYTQEELSEIIRTKSGIDFGEILDLVPLKRGASGRIYELKIVGTKHTETIGKELKIRLWLSKSCLYSSWFDIKKESKVKSQKSKAITFTLTGHGWGKESKVESQKSKAITFTLTGHGWGHGAGLCQIGAAVMASEGKTYEEILSYYYRNSELKVNNF